LVERDVTSAISGSSTTMIASKVPARSASTSIGARAGDASSLPPPPPPIEVLPAPASSESQACATLSERARKALRFPEREILPEVVLTTVPSRAGE